MKKCDLHRLLKLLSGAEGKKKFLPRATPKSFHAPNLSNMRALACMRRIKNFDSKTPSDPMFAPVSVKRSSLSEPEKAEASNTGTGCQECPFIAHGVE